MINFTTLYDKHIDNLFAFGSRFSSDREMIKDCIQDVFVKLYTKKESLDSVENIDSYLYASLSNRINDEYRRNVRLCDKEINDVNMKKIAEADAFVLERQERQQILSASIEQFFEKLSPRQQQIINLYYIEQRKYDDICQIMGINYQSVRNLMHRSIMRLRSLAATIDVAV
jgi:RNA polymerase sigma factor (sigma-70 family)